MSNMTDNELKHYFKNVRLLFPVYSKTERRFLDDLKENVQDYMENNQDATLDNITNEFGEPKEIVSNYIDGLPDEYLYNRISVSKLIRRIGIVALILILTYFAFIFTLAYENHKTAENTNIVVEDTDIIVEEEVKE